MQQILKELTVKEDNINIGLDQGKREKIVEILAQLLADEHVFYMKLRNYHWNVEGMQFQPLHALFESQYNDIAPTIDDIAERIRSLGFYSPGSMQQMAQLARLSETGHLNGNAEKMLQNILVDQELLIQVLRRNITEIEQKYNDAGTMDFLTGIMEMHEKMAWMIRAHIS